MKRFISLCTIDTVAIIIALFTSGYLIGRSATEYYERD